MTEENQRLPEFDAKWPGSAQNELGVVQIRAVLHPDCRALDVAHAMVNWNPGYVMLHTFVVRCTETDNQIVTISLLDTTVPQPGGEI